MLRRAFPMVPEVTATVCAVLGLGAARQLYDAQRLDLPLEVPRGPSNPEPPSPPAVAPVVGVEDPLSMLPPPPKPLPPARVREPLRLVLVATSVASDERGSTATILSGPAVGVDATGERMPGGAILAHVARTASTMSVEIARRGQTLTRVVRIL